MINPNDFLNFLKNGQAPQVNSVPDGPAPGTGNSSTISVEKKSEPSLWEQSFEDFPKITDELLDEDYAQEVQGEHALDYILEKPRAVIEAITQYLDENNVPFVAEDTIVEGQTFCINNKIYLLQKPNVLQDITKIMLDLQDYAILKKTVKNGPLNFNQTLLKQLQLPETQLLHPLLDTLPKHILYKIIIRVLSFSVTNRIIYKKETEYKITKSTLATQLGKLMLETYLQLYITHSCIEEDKVPEYVLKTFAQLEDLYQSFKTKQQTILDNYPQSLHLLILHNLEKHLNELNEIKYPLSLETEKQIAKDSLELGLALLNWMIKLGIFTELNSNRNVPELIFTKTQYLNAVASSSYYKPLITLQKFPTIYTHKIGDKFSVDIDLNQCIIKNTSEIKIKGTSKLTDVLHYYTSVPFVVNKSQLNAFISLLKTVLAIGSITNATTEKKIKEKKQLIIFAKLFYDVDFDSLYANNTSPSVIDELLMYTTHILGYTDSSLAKAITNNIGLTLAYNKISSIKYLLKGLVNDLYIFSHFSEFFIAKYVTSTGRIFSKSFFLQLQGHKFALAFLEFKKQPTLNENTYSILKSILKKELPSFKIPDEYIDHKKKIDYNYFLFVQSFLTQPANQIKGSYPENSSELEQLSWLALHSKKNKYLFFIRDLIAAGFTSKYLSKLFTLDATASGIQIISILMRDYELAKKTNLVGTSYVDLYGECTTLFKLRMTEITASSTIFKEQVFDYKATYDSITHEVEYNLTQLLVGPLSDFEKQFADLIPKLNKNPVLTKRIVDFYFPFTSFNSKNDIIQLKEKSALFKALYMANRYICFTTLLAKLPADFFTRKLFKVTIMALGYSQGNESRLQSFKDIILDYYASRGYPQIPLYEDELDEIADIMLFYFNSYSKTNYSTTSPATNKPANTAGAAESPSTSVEQKTRQSLWDQKFDTAPQMTDDIMDEDYAQEVKDNMFLIFSLKNLA